MSLRTGPLAASRGRLAEAGRRLAPVAGGFASGSSPCCCPTARGRCSGQPGGPAASCTSTTRRPWRMILNGEMGAGEAYMDGHWSSPDLPACSGSRRSIGRPSP